MLAASTKLKEVYKNDSSIRVSAYGKIEYNMNMLIDGITVYSSIPDTAYTEPLTMPSGAPWPNGKPSPFKKLFPMDAVVRPFRPSSSGVSYAILGSNEIYSYTNPKGQTYMDGIPRVYYPGKDTTYKYWLAPKGINADLTVRYFQTSDTWKSALDKKIIPSTSTSIPIGNKAALANKIIVHFDKYSGLPKDCTVKIEKNDGTFTTITKFDNPGAAWEGLIEFYYNGSSWTTTEPSEYSEGILIKSINVKATASGGENDPINTDRIAIIEISARLVKSIKENLISDFSLVKQTSANENDILPVGFVNSNTLTLSLSDLNQDAINFKDYNRYSSSFANSTGWVNPNIFYLIKNAKIEMYVRTYHANGGSGSTDKYDDLKQGIFYIDNYSIDEYGVTTISCLDSSKYLMDTFAPDLLLQNYSVTAILRVLLDNVGFTDYNFNLKPTTYLIDETIEMTDGPDASVPQIRYWWTSENSSIWEHIQSLCRDIQMNAFFDENGILQFYSRDYLYAQDLAAWTFRYNQYAEKLPNIIAFEKREIASANQVIVKWNSPIESNYLSNSTYLWQSPVSYLVAGGLRQRIPNPNASVTSASVANGIITYNAKNKYIAGQKVTVTGLKPASYNVVDQPILSATDNSFTVASTITDAFVGLDQVKTASISGVEKGDGTTKYLGTNTFSVGDMIIVSGCKSSFLNFSSYHPIIEATSSYFVVARTKYGDNTTGGVAVSKSTGSALISPESTALYVNISQTSSYSKYQTGFNFTGYFLIDSEIIEFDAMEYVYIPMYLDGGVPNDEGINPKRVFIASDADLTKYRYLAKNGYSDPNKPAETAYFKPTGRYRIKTRGALGTSPDFHNSTSDYPLSAWRGINVNWGEGS